ncbi:MAG: nucleoside hydrolase [Bacteroidia bacterium]|nr:nucleoside hydrolase [Bacteroidia bacterium]
MLAPKYFIPFIIIVFTIVISVFPVSAQKLVNKSMIIDTDCATDDLRAICLLLAQKETSIAAITAADGSLAPEEGYIKVKSLLTDLNMSDIPVGTGRRLDNPPPSWRKFCSETRWGNETNIKSNSITALQLIFGVLDAATNPVTIICLGPLTDISDVLKSKPQISSKISRILWYNDSFDPLKGFNYEADTIAAKFIISSAISMDIICSVEPSCNLSDKDFLQSLDRINTVFAKKVVTSMHEDSGGGHPRNGHLKLYDELVAVYFLFPDVFDMKQDIFHPEHKFSTAYQCPTVREDMFDIYAQTYSLEKNICFVRFPVDTSVYQPDVREIARETLNKFGTEEWKACVLTNEIHGHLGIYSIVGAKMGVKAKELLGAETDRMEVVSYAGKDQPLSCMNDGLQVSTGGTMGVNMISLKETGKFIPEAEFTWKGKHIKLKLKDQYISQAEKDIQNGIVKYGNLSSGYWKLVRKLAILYWNSWSRDEIFEIIND